MDAQHEERQRLSLTQVNRQIRDESIAIYYGQNTFRLGFCADDAGAPKPLRQWLRSLKTNAQLLNTVEVIGRFHEQTVFVIERPEPGAPMQARYGIRTGFKDSFCSIWFLENGTAKRVGELCQKAGAAGLNPGQWLAAVTVIANMW